MKKQAITTFEQAVDYLYHIPRFTDKHSMEQTREYLHFLKDPDKKLKIIHVAGTNGKGSTCAFLRSILEKAGYRVALFTSPHLVDVRERFMIGGEMVSKEAFLDAFLRIYDSLVWEQLETGRGYHPTFFEYLFFMAMLLFESAAPDYCILETGLGGRLDATNSVARKEISIITRISLDHVEYLGDTTVKIAGEKAGIMQKGTPAVCLETDADVCDVFRRYAKEIGAPLYLVSDTDYELRKIHHKNIDFSLRSEYYDYIGLTLSTCARYQMENAALAVRAVEVLDGGRTVSRQHIVDGVRDCFWAGRMEEVAPDVFVDGAHNEDGIRAFLESVAGDGWDGRRRLLFAAVGDKDYPGMLKRIAQSGLFDRIALVKMHSARAVGTQELARCLHADEIYADVEEALRKFVFGRGSGERVYIAGSLYLVGEVKALL